AFPGSSQFHSASEAEKSLRLDQKTAFAPVRVRACTHKSPSPVRFRGQSGQRLLILSFSAFDAVDGAHSAASKCYRLVCVKARAIQGGEARKRRRRLKFEGIGEDMTT